MAEIKRTKTADDLAIKMCEALELDSSNIQRITINLNTGLPIELEIIAHNCDGALENVDWSKMWQDAEITVKIIKFKKD